MKKYSIKVITQNMIVFEDIVKAHDAGHAISRISGILEAYEDFKIECNLVKDGE